ncbi:hypothetical protein MKI79_02105 [Acinetobacter sp. A3.8]|uniref:Uncharacterized protein n=1 Tax=Acinetobacter sedimenti TaxID=2919922 RepID=A0A9X1WW53_9GAMM|nr:hypothetical protein [Acinetobacter sedimenti]MCJ8145713.1 hypothetical protein [Acinetobacter sedimenti]
MTTNNKKDSPNKDKSEKSPNKWKQAMCGLFGEMIGQLIPLLLFFAVANIYAAYAFLGLGAFFLILPFGMLSYYAWKKWVKGQ